ncbi:glycosyltransferase family 39 protein [Symmachiella dynata]|uniref:ArnT family glycosyltransferase n=1 Tax=Symmachiella dynata TaxID=2527995 RepID=UPI0030EF4C53
MKRIFRHETWILIAALIAFFTNLGATRLWDEDESFFAATAAEMHQRGEWTVPYFNGELFSHKPPFMYWMMLVGYELFGDSEFAVRFWSAIFGTATALLTYYLGRRLFNAEVGLWAGLAMTSSLMFDVVARAATADSFLVFFSALSLYAFVVGSQQRNPAVWSGDDTETPADGPHPLLPSTWWTFAAMYAVMGLAVLVKGPIGVLLPTATIGLFLLCTSPGKPISESSSWISKLGAALAIFHPRLFFKTIWQMKPLTAIAMVTLVAGPWFLAVSMQTGGTFVLEFLGIHNFGRFMNSMDGHSGPIFYYLPVIMIGFFPWSIFALQTLRDTAQRIGNRDHWRIPCLFLACWASVFIGFFSLASTKLPNYTLTAYPALALLTAVFLHRWIHQTATVPVGWIRSALGTFTAVGVLLVVVCPVLGLWRVEGVPLLTTVGVSTAVSEQLPLAGVILGIGPLVGGIAAMMLAKRGRPQQAVASIAMASVVFVTCVLAVVAVRADRHQTSAEIADTIKFLDRQGEVPVAQYKYFRPSLIYYTRRPVAPCKTPKDIRDFFASSEQAVMITTAKKHESIKELLPADVVILEQRPQFPKQGTVLLLGKQPQRLAGRNRPTY